MCYGEVVVAVVVVVVGKCHRWTNVSSALVPRARYHILRSIHLQLLGLGCNTYAIFSDGDRHGTSSSISSSLSLSSPSIPSSPEMLNDDDVNMSGTGRIEGLRLPVGGVRKRSYWYRRHSEAHTVCRLTLTSPLVEDVWTEQVGVVAAWNLEMVRGRDGWRS